MTEELWDKIVQIEDNLEAAQRLSHVMWMHLSQMARGQDYEIGEDGWLGLAELAWFIHDNVNKAAEIFDIPVAINDRGRLPS